MQQINLYRPIFRRQEKKFSAVAMLQAGAAVLAGVVIIFGLMFWRVYDLRGQLVDAEKKLVSANKRLTDATQKFGVTSSGGTIEEQTTQLEKQLAARQRLQDVLSRGLFSNTTGFSDFFVALARQHVSGVWLTGFHIVGAGEEVNLQGRTNDPAQVPRYLQRLSAEQSLAGKEFRVFVMSRPEKKQGQTTEPNYVDFMFKTGLPKEQGKS